MKYMLMMNSAVDGYERYAQWPKAVLQANVAFMRNFAKQLREAGELVSTEGLGSPRDAKIVRAGRDGRPVTDGVFPESKEFLAGYWIVDVDTPERAWQIAADASKAPGPDTEAGPLWIEVREVMSAPPA